MKVDFCKSDNDLNVVIKILIFVIMSLLIYLSFKNLLIFHTIIELFSICICLGIGLIAINSYNYYNNNFFAFLAVTFFFVGILEVIHTITYMVYSINFIKEPSYKNIYIQVVVVAKYMRIISFISALCYIKKKISLLKIGVIYLIITISIYISIFVIKKFPIFYINGQGQTQCKLISNFILLGLTIYALFILHKNKKEFKPNVYKLLILHVVFWGFSNSIWIVHTLSYNVSHLISHYLKFISFCMLYSVVIKMTLKYPYESIFKQLNKKAIEMEELNEKLKKKNIELHKAKTNIKKSKEKYEKILDLLPDPVVIVEVQTLKIEYVNSAFVKLFKFNSKEDIIDKHVMKAMPIKSYNMLKRRIRENSEKAFIPFKKETLFTTDGEAIKTEVSTILIELGNKGYRLNMIRNIEERNQYERLKLELEERDNLRIEFFANICHELRTPINVIYSALQLQDIYIKNNNVEQMNKYNNISKQNCYRLLKLCNNLIDINKLDSGFIKPTMKSCNIVELIENIADSVTPYIKNKKLNIIFDTNVEEKYIICDFNFMERILLNLLSNAIKFSKEDGTIWVNVIDKKDELIISVRDNGIGIPENKQKAIFERFIQADKSFRRQCEGSGIGLSLVRSFVEIQGGKIECTSKEGKETEFVVKFPINNSLEESAISLQENEISSYRMENKVSVEFSDIYFN